MTDHLTKLNYIEFLLENRKQFRKITAISAYSRFIIWARIALYKKRKRGKTRIRKFNRCSNVHTQRI